MDINNFPNDSDSSDEDYIPGAKPEEVVSEEDSDGDVEEPLGEIEEGPKKKRGKTKRGNTKKLKSETSKQGDTEHDKETPKVELTEEEKKKQVDALWADFLQDTGFKSKNSIGKSNSSSISKQNNTSNSEVPSKLKKPTTSAQEKIKVTKIFEFAGEEVRVEEEVPKDSAEARLLGTSNTVSKGKSGSLSGIGNVLSQLGKKTKISTLEKTKLDWNRYKKEENLEEELTAYKKGKDGYLERQDFLERADLRQFEIEKERRNVERNKRMNMGGPF